MLKGQLNSSSGKHEFQNQIQICTCRSVWPAVWNVPFVLLHVVAGWKSQNLLIQKIKTKFKSELFRCLGVGSWLLRTAGVFGLWAVWLVGLLLMKKLWVSRRLFTDCMWTWSSCSSLSAQWLTDWQFIDLTGLYWQNERFYTDWWRLADCCILTRAGLMFLTYN